MQPSIEVIQLVQLKELWTVLFTVPPPSDEQFGLWVFKHGPEVVRAAIGQLATKYQKTRGAMDQDFMIRFASSVMIRLTRESDSRQNRDASSCPQSASESPRRRHDLSDYAPWGDELGTFETRRCA